WRGAVRGLAVALGRLGIRITRLAAAADRGRRIDGASRAPPFGVSQPLLVVDVQRGFINEFTRHIPARIARLIDTGEYFPVLFTLFVNSPESPYHRLLDWHACTGPPDTELVPELASHAVAGSVFEKRGLTGVPDALAERLRNDRVEEVTLVGIDTD